MTSLICGIFKKKMIQMNYLQNGYRLIDTENQWLQRGKVGDKLAI